MGEILSPGLYGADIAQLRALSKSMGLSGSRLLNTEQQINSLVGSTLWKGNDGEQFRREWSGNLRPMLHRASQSLSDASKMLLTQADEQQRASSGSGELGSSGRPSDTPNTGWEGVQSLIGSPGWWAANTGVTSAGLFADDLLATMSKGGLITKLTNWPWLNAQYGQAAGMGYIRGTQTLNGAAMLGRLSGALGVVTGGFQIAQGIHTGNTGMAIDGGISAVLAGGSFIPGVGPFFAVAGIAWGGMGLLATHLGYGSASEMVADGAKHVWEGAQNVASSVADGAKEAVDAVADGAKKVWGWVT